MKRFTKVILAMVLIVFSYFNIVAQNVNPLFLDGGVYVKISDHATLNVANDNGKINPEDVYFVRNLIDKYQITNVDMTFLSSSSNIMQRTFTINFNNKDNVDLLIKDLKTNPDVEYVERIPLYFKSSTPDDLYYDETLTGSYNGTNLGQTSSSWHLNTIKADEAWDLNAGSSSIVVAVLDNAVWIDHPDLTNKIVAAIDLADGDNDPNPPFSTYNWSHGTHVAGIIAGETNNSIGIASVGNGISLMAIKLAMDSGDGQTLTSVAEGIIWASDNGADIINVSFSSTEWSQTLFNAVNYASNKGCVIVAPAGNNANSTKCYPAALENVIAVASSDIGNNKSTFSNYGEWIDVVAPGGYSTNGNSQGFGRFSILSTTANLPGDIEGVVPGTTGGAASYSDSGSNPVSGNYDIMNGTSMAAAVTSGICGLMLSANDELTPAKVKEILKSTCDNINQENPSYNGQLGAGRVNALNAVQTAIDTDSDFVANFEANTTFINVRDDVDFTDKSVGTPTSWEWEFEGGVPETSNEQNPTVKYNSRGVFSVKLTVKKENNESTEIKEGFIIVGNQPANYENIAKSVWIEQNPNLPVGVLVSKISPANNDTVWIFAVDAVTGIGTNNISRTKNAGDTWQSGLISLGSADYVPMDIAAASYDIAWVIADNTNGDGGVFKTVDGGTTWTQQTSATFNNASSKPAKITMYNENEGISIGNPINNKFEVYRTTNGGQSWVSTTNTPNALQDEEITTNIIKLYNNDTLAWFGTSKGRVFKTIDGGQSWTMSSLNGEMSVKSLSFGNNTTGLAYLDNPSDENDYMVRRTVDGGVSWTTITVDQGGPLVDISITPGSINEYVAIVKDNTIQNNCKSIYSSNAGRDWSVVDTAIVYSNISLYSINRGWAGSYVYEYSQGIYKWVEAPVLTTTSLDIVEGDTILMPISAYDVDGKPIVITAQYSNNYNTFLSFKDNGDGTAEIYGKSIPIGSLQWTRYEFTFRANNGVRTTEKPDSIIVRTTKTAPVFLDVENIPKVAYTYKEYVADIKVYDPDTHEFIRIYASRLPEYIGTGGTTYSWLGLTDNGDNTAVLAGVPIYAGINSVEISVEDGLFTITYAFDIDVIETGLNVNDFDIDRVQVYPNPSTDYINISNSQGAQYQIFDLVGKLIKEGQINSSVEKIDISDLSNGNLVLKLFNSDKVYTTKIVKM